MKKIIFANLLLLFSLTTYAQNPCANNNVLYATTSAPTVIRDSVFAPDIYGGEYVIINNMIAGSIYRVSTCNNSNFDTQISIYNSSGIAVAYNDDWCGMYSEIIFSPPITGSYRILVDEYDCISNQIPAQLVVELIYTARPVIEIPVVVHVLYNTPQQNISDAQINSQISVLNEDFRRLNLNQQNAPAAFRGRAMDPLIQFCLAQRDPNGNPTNGITRTYTNKQEFTFLDTTIYFTNLGGKSNWDKNSYLNIWVCNIADPYAGWALFPSITVNIPIIDGVVMDYESFGTMGTANPNYNNGHMCSHEVGHWLNLRHIWGDDQNSPNVCLGSDSVFDTPNHAVENFGSPTYPHITSCSIDGLGEMFMNFMDYTDDDENLNMFTVGQFIRMDDILFNERASLWNSLGCLAPCNVNSEFTTSTNTACVGQTVIFTNQSSSGSYNWLVDGLSYGSSINFSGIFSSAGQYNVSLIVSNNGCSDTSSRIITVLNSPATPTFLPVSGCSPLTVTASSSNCTGCSYQWSTGATGTTATFTANSNFTVTVTNSNGCSASANGSATVSNIPSIVISSTSPSICSGNTVTLTTSPVGSAYNWSGPNGFSSNSSSAAIVSGGTYTVTVTNPGSCSGTATASITIQQGNAPIANAGSDVTITQGNTATLVASGGTTYQWSTGETTASINVSPNNTTTYTVTVTDANGCSSSDAVAVFVQSGGCNNIFTLSATSANIGASGGNVNVTLNTDAGCTWNINDGGCINWVSSNISTVAGNYLITFTVEPNSLPSQRTCFVTIAGELFTIIQEAAPTTGIVDFSGINNVVVYPNPNNGMFTLTLENTLKQSLDLSMFNVLGQTITNKKVELTNGNNSIDFDLSKHASGIYYLQLKNENKIRFIKISVSR